MNKCRVIRSGHVRRAKVYGQKIKSRTSGRTSGRTYRPRRLHSLATEFPGIIYRCPICGRAVRIGQAICGWCRSSL